MKNHIHLLATPSDIQGINRMMQYIRRHYVPYINHTYGGNGSIWEGRYKANLVQDDRYLLTCMRYIELNPVRADISRAISFRMI
jgi:putative transposase